MLSCWAESFKVKLIQSGHLELYITRGSGFGRETRIMKLVFSASPLLFYKTLFGLFN